MMECLLLTEEERKKTIRILVGGSILIGLLFICDWTDPKPEIIIALHENISEIVVPGLKPQKKESVVVVAPESCEWDNELNNYKREKIRRMMIDMDTHPMRYYYDDMTKPCLDY